jgi:dTDP-L-rhamnose 4-epimerase
MRILVTGGAGFIGSHTVDALLSRGHEVKILDNFEERVHRKRRPSYVPKEVEVIEGDVRNKDDWRKALRGVNAVYHMAAYQDYMPDFSKFFHVNAAGTALLYEVALEEKIPLSKVVVASSQAVYGEGKYRCPNVKCQSSGKDGRVFYPDIRSAEQLAKGEWEHRCPRCGATLEWQLTDESRVNPQNQYGISKIAQELIALNLGRRYGIPTVAFRYSIVQGPRQSFYNAYSGACRIFCVSYFFDRQPVVYEDGKQIRDFVNINDVVEAHLLALEKDEANYQAFNVGGGKACTILEFAEIVRRVFGKKLPPKITGEYRFGDTRHSFSDISKLQALGWKPRYSPEKSVADYKKWLEEQSDVPDVAENAKDAMRDSGVLRQARC